MIEEICSWTLSRSALLKIPIFLSIRSISKPTACSLFPERRRLSARKRLFSKKVKELLEGEFLVGDGSFDFLPTNLIFPVLMLPFFSLFSLSSKLVFSYAMICFFSLLCGMDCHFSIHSHIKLSLTYSPLTRVTEQSRIHTRWSCWSYSGFGQGHQFEMKVNSLTWY